MVQLIPSSLSNDDGVGGSENIAEKMHTVCVLSNFIVHLSFA